MIKVTNLSKFFENKVVFQNLNFEVKTGTCLGIIGANGAGKTTLIKCLVNLIEFKGKITINCNSGQLEIKKAIGLVADFNLLIEEFTVLEYLEYLALIYQIPDYESRFRIESLGSAFYNFDWETNRNLPIKFLSRGNKQKVTIIASLLHKPSILIFDEPFVGLDFKSINVLISIIKNFCKNKIVIVASHDFLYLQQVCTEIAIFEGKNLLFTKDLHKYLVEGLKLKESQKDILNQSIIKNLDWIV